ncbi:hypothetical protein J6590_065600 [Homalodisca vitripennis]|nr:hypothetical protein J6590_065600 [Homalodisca vitripennis]
MTDNGGIIQASHGIQTISSMALDTLPCVPRCDTLYRSMVVEWTAKFKLLSAPLFRALAKAFVLPPFKTVNGFFPD